MHPREFAEARAFAAIVEHGSFVQAALHLGVTPSAVSQMLRSLEKRLGTRLLVRTTRSLAPTEAGARYAAALHPLLAGLDDAAVVVHAERAPRSTLRVNASRIAALHVLAPLLPGFHVAHPNVDVEIVLQDDFIDIVQAGFDAGIRLGDQVEKDMIALSMSDKVRMAVVAAPSYLAAHGTPTTPADLRKHRCIRWRHVSTGLIYRWEFVRRGRRIRTPVDGPLTIHDAELTVRAAQAGVGIAYVLDLEAAPAVASGSLVRVLEGWLPTRSGFHLYYPHREPLPAGLSAFVHFVRSRKPAPRASTRDR
jgi:DNA-binding transcriptional LysR family regulator